MTTRPSPADLCTHLNSTACIAYLCLFGCVEGGGGGCGEKCVEGMHVWMVVC